MVWTWTIQHVKNFLEPREQKLQENAKEPISVGRGWTTHSPYNAHPHIADAVTKNFTIMCGKCYLMRPTAQTWVHQTSTYYPKLKEPMRGRFSSLEELFIDGVRAIRHMNKSGVLDGIIMLPKRWDSGTEKKGEYIEGLWTDNLKQLKVLVKKNSVRYFLNGPHI